MSIQTLLVNGQEHPYQTGMTIASLLAPLAGAAGSLVVEQNGVIIPHGQFESTPLSAGDSIEIVHFVGGG